MWENYDKEINEFDEEQVLFNPDALNEQDLKNLLLTWKTYDDTFLSQDAITIDLDGYKGEYCNQKLYLIHKGFTTKNLSALLSKIDKDTTFNPQTIIAFAYNFNSKNLREIDEAVKSYSNKKGAEIYFVGRYWEKEEKKLCA